MAPKTPITWVDNPELMIVVIGGPDTLAQAVRRVAASEIGAGVAVASVSEATTIVAEYRPFAILICTGVYALDPHEFDALARDVGAKLIPIETYGHASRIAEAITPLLMGAVAAHAER